MNTDPLGGGAATALLVLASSSRYRRELLARLARPFLWQAPNIDESARPGESADALVRRLGLAKSRALAPAYPAHLIIGSDQVAVNGDQILGKPAGREQAIAQLTAAAGRTVRFLTSVCVLDTRSGEQQMMVVSTEVRFRPLRRRQIAVYVEHERPFDCAGSFKAEGLGIALFEGIDGSDPTALIGLPLIALTAMLARAGVDVLAATS